jgi:hypothetical protein
VGGRRRRVGEENPVERAGEKELKLEDGESSHILEGAGKGVTKERKWRGGERVSEWEG